MFGRARQWRLAGVSTTMLVALFLAMSMGTSVLGSQPSQRARGDIPGELLSVYQAAAATCPGLPWSVLAAIGKLESDHGRSKAPGVASGTSSAGAAGPSPPRDGKFVAPDNPSYQRLTPTAKRLYATVWRTFKITSIGGWRSVGSVEGSDHPHGRALDVMIPYPSAPGRVVGWRIAKWAVAGADRYDVKYVIFNGRIWTRGRGWHGYRHPSDPCNCNPTLRHDDHVHISVRH